MWWCTVGYGQTGPYANRPGYDVMIEAEAGLMYITGEENGPPVKVGVAVTGKILEDQYHIPPFVANVDSETHLASSP